MNLTVKRVAKRQKYTIGRLYINDVYFCDTLEDTDRGLDSSMTTSEIARKKIKNNTAIPKGSYLVVMNIVSPKYSNYERYPFAKEYNGKMPRLLGVKGYEGILIHPGNTHADTAGCLLVGENKVVGKVINSQATFKKLYAKLKDATDNGERITINII